MITTKDIMKNKAIKIDKKLENIIKILLLFSWPIFNFYLGDSTGIKGVIFGSIIIFLFLLFYLRKIKITKLYCKTLVVAFILSCYLDNLFMNIIRGSLLNLVNVILLHFNIKFLYQILYFTFSIMFLPTLVFVIYLFLNKGIPVLKENIKEEIKKSDDVDKKYLFLVLIIGIILSTLVMSTTQIFGRVEGISYNVVYTSDSSYLTSSDVWTSIGNLENDIRQPFFGLFALPFSIPAHIISELIFFIPNEYSYQFVMIIMQFFIMSLTIIMLSRLMKIEEKNKKYFYLLLSFNFPVILFGLVLEQYVIGLFYLVLTIYLYQKQKKDEINNTYIGAVGTLSTSIVLFPFITKFDTLKNWINKVFKCFFNAVLLLILSGRVSLIYTFINNFNLFKNYTGAKVTWYGKLCQYLNFVESIFISPKGAIVMNGFPSYQMIEVTGVSIIGIIILGIMIISFILNRKEKMAKISFLWILYSLLILFIVGWGTQENGLILYSLYFYWAFYILYYMFIKKVIKNNKLSNIVITISSVILLFTACFTLYEILKFGINYYPR